MKKPAEKQELADTTADPVRRALETVHVNKIFTLLCRGLDRDLISAFAKEKGWTETATQLDEMIETAIKNLIEAAAEIDTEAELGKALVRLNNLYMNCDKVQDFKTALAIQKEINKVLALKVTAAGAAAGVQPKEATRPKLKIVAK